MVVLKKIFVLKTKIFRVKYTKALIWYYTNRIDWSN
jgi:hypothetical protein